MVDLAEKTFKRQLGQNVAGINSAVVQVVKAVQRKADKDEIIRIITKRMNDLESVLHHAMEVPDEVAGSTRCLSCGNTGNSFGYHRPKSANVYDNIDFENPFRQISRASPILNPLILDSNNGSYPNFANDSANNYPYYTNVNVNSNNAYASSPKSIHDDINGVSIAGVENNVNSSELTDLNVGERGNDMMDETAVSSHVNPNSVQQNSMSQSSALLSSQSVGNSIDGISNDQLPLYRRARAAAKQKEKVKVPLHISSATMPLMVPTLQSSHHLYVLDNDNNG